MTKPTKRAYSFHFKLALVERFVAGETAQDLALETGLSPPKLLETWAGAYRGEVPDVLRPKAKDRAKEAAASPERKPRQGVSWRLDPFQAAIETMLADDTTAQRKQRRAARRILARLIEEHGADELSYVTVRVPGDQLEHPPLRIR